MKSQRGCVTPLRHIRIISVLSAAFPFPLAKPGATPRTFGISLILPALFPLFSTLRPRLTSRSSGPNLHGLVSSLVFVISRLRSASSRRLGRLASFVRPRSPFSFCLLVWSGFGKRIALLRPNGITDHFSFFGSSGIGLSLTHQQSAHGFLPSSRSLQLLGLHSHAITPVFSFGARRHEPSLSLKQAQIQARRVFGWPMLGARPNLALNSDPACIAFRSLSAVRYPGSAQCLGAGGAG